MITRRGILKLIGAGAVGTLMAPMGCQMDKKSLKAPILRFAQLTDMHLLPDSPAEEGVKKCIRHLLSNEEKIDFIINGGDLIMDALDKNKQEVESQWEIWRNIKNSFPDLTFYHCLGNHDVWGLTPNIEKYQGKEWALRELGLESPYYHFETQGWHFIVLDSTHLRPDGRWYTAKLDLEQKQWFKNTLASIKSEEPILIISHIPILGASTFLDGDNLKNGDWVVPGAWMHTDAKELIKLFYQHKNIKLCISGHIHLLEKLVYNNVHYYCSGAVCGNWWENEPYEETNKGYAVIELFDDGSHTYKYVEFEA